MGEVNGVSAQSDRRKNSVKIDLFINDKHPKKDSLIAVIFLLAFLFIGKMENNWVLPNSDLGLREHKNIWIFLLINFFVPLIISLSYKVLEYNVDMDSIKKLKCNFQVVSESKAAIILQRIFKAVGFCFFVGNSLQNAHLINELPFDYWDSINYLGSYIASRFYKLYLFVFFLPTVIIYGLILLGAIQKTITNNEKTSNFIENYEQINSLCNFGLDIMLILIVPFVIEFIAVYSIHDRFDLITMATIIVSVAFTLAAFAAYAFIIKSFYISISKYKRENTKKINRQLTKIHRYVLNCRLEANNDKKLDLYLKKEECLCRIKEDIDSISKCPHILKAMFTIVSPIVPSLLKILFTFKNASQI